MLTVLLGGARSGKSAAALRIAQRSDGDVCFVATSPRIDGDPDLDRRIEAHRAERPVGWRTIEAELDLAAAIASAGDAHTIVDCLTVWLGNLVHHGRDDDEILAASTAAVTATRRRTADTTVVTNEVGLGIVPADAATRRYRDLLGRINQQWVGAADEALFLIAGRTLPLTDLGAPVSDPIRSLLRDLPPFDAASADAVHDHARQVLRPVGALQRLDDVAVHVAGWQGSTTPTVARPAVLVFAGDHGVTAAGVSNYPAEVTAAMLAAVRAGRATINAFARAAGASLDVFDVGVGRPTGDIRTEPALTPDRFDEIVAVAVDAVDATATAGADVLVLGELGIGNTTISAALAAALVGGDVAEWVGRGTGVDDDGLTRKRTAVTQAVAHVAAIRDPIEVMRQIGGAEHAAIAAACIRARHLRIPVVLDGYVATSAVLPVHIAVDGALAHCLAGHVSSEPGHRRLLDHLGLSALLDLGMRLGEGTGALAAVPLIRMACAGVVEVPTFAEWFDA